MGGAMKARDDKTETSKEQELVGLLKTLTDHHLKKSPLASDFQNLFADKKAWLGKKAAKNPHDTLEALRQKLDSINVPITIKNKPIEPIYDPKDPQYTSKKLLREHIPSILKTLKNNGIDEALSETKSLIEFLDNQALVKKGFKK